MKLWLITRTDSADYDETNALVLRAETEDDARTESLTPDPDFSDDEYFQSKYNGLRPDNIHITELTAEGEAGLVIRDFIRG